ncbi:hypothetical protein F2Q69_00022606 [Brassica cretica]|uniref:Uncharacterized protein n=1 Tax=Brassica cretica TaxID=69181 RepID=A0A8S9Q4Z3_BRACR|nr:hypothetical protein F2Q69_00022606 [Brassica cretica]
MEVSQKLHISKRRIDSSIPRTIRTCLYASRSNTQASSSEITRAPGSAVSKTPSEAPTFSIFDKTSAVQER